MPGGGGMFKLRFDWYVRSINAEQGCSHTELLMVGNRNKLVYLTSQITALGRTKRHYIFHSSVTDKTHRIQERQ